MIRIFLTGYMGAGKTTLGKAFARELNIPFIDLDWYIEERFHKSIRELFIERGEASFRELERTMLHEVAEFENVIMFILTFCSVDCEWLRSNVPFCKEKRTKNCGPSL